MPLGGRESMQTSANSAVEFRHALSFVPNPRLTDERESWLANAKLRNALCSSTTTFPIPMT